MEKIKYDRYGRMEYNPEFHSKNRTPWSTTDLNYLINWYDIIGPEEMSFALDRTSKTIMEKVSQLRKSGLMKRPLVKIKHQRIKKELPKQPK